MSSSKRLLALSLIVVVVSAGCGGGSTKNCTPVNAPNTAAEINSASVAAVSGANVLPLTVNGSTCAANSYQNKPCVSVTICKAGSSGATDCQTITDVLLDTGSYGFRVFKQAVTNSALLADLNAANVAAPGGGNLMECAQYGDGSAQWGPVVNADVVLGGEPAVTVPIELIDSTYGAVPSSCPSPATDPADGGFNGILGLGLFASDCGAGCAKSASVGVYFSCAASNSTSCPGSKAPIASQVTNPVSALPVDKNGVIMELPAVAIGGAPSASGYLVLGIGTASNNAPPSSVAMYAADPNFGEFSTNFNCNSYSSFVDSGSNALFLQAPSGLPDCSTTDANAAGWFCPTTVQAFTATTVGNGSGNQVAVNFNIGNFLQLADSGNNVFAEIGADGGFGSSGTEVFDWGLPFYLGRNVYVGIENSSSTLGTGPYWAY
jgi:hypothetical protein